MVIPSLFWALVGLITGNDKPIRSAASPPIENGYDCGFGEHTAQFILPATCRIPCLSLSTDRSAVSTTGFESASLLTWSGAQTERLRISPFRRIFRSQRRADEAAEMTEAQVHDGS